MSDRVARQGSGRGGSDRTPRAAGCSGSIVWLGCHCQCSCSCYEFSRGLSVVILITPLEHIIGKPLAFPSVS